MLITKRIPLSAINFLRPIQSASMPANSVEMALPSKTAATMNESCLLVQSGSRFQVRQRAGNDPDIDAVKQSAQPGDEQKETIVTRLACSRDSAVSLIHIF